MSETQEHRLKPMLPKSGGGADGDQGCGEIDCGAVVVAGDAADDFSDSLFHFFGGSAAMIFLKGAASSRTDSQASCGGPGQGHFTDTF